MIVVPPISITDALLYSSNIVEPDANDSGATAWVSGSAYTVGAYVYRPTTHKIYKCINAITAGSAASTALPEVSVFNTSSPWVEDRPTNKWDMFDLLRNTATKSSTGEISVVLKPDQRIDAVALVGLVNVSHITIIATYGTIGMHTVIDEDLADGTTSILELDVPPFYNVTLSISLYGTGTIECGGCIIGIYKDLGNTQSDVSVDSTNFSTVDRDTYGAASMVQRRSIPRISLTTFIRPEAVNLVSEIRDRLNATPALWSGMNTDNTHNYYESLLIVGFYKTFRFSLDNPIGVFVDLELEEI